MQVLVTLHDERYVDLSPAQVVHRLMDEEGIYLCSERTMYRILAAEGELRERRAQVRRPAYQAPELVATGPNQVWSWDITKLRGPVSWTWFYLYVILDIFSRYVVGWMVALRESGRLAEHLISESIDKQGMAAHELTVHSDWGPAMRSKCVAQLLADLGVTKSLTRPYVPNDNPFSESQFKTLKYHPGFPDRFGSVQDARSYARSFFPWYNQRHYHSGLGFYTPASVHYGKAEEVRERRLAVLRQAYRAHPNRFVRGEPRPRPIPSAVWINPPTSLSIPGGTDPGRSEPASTDSGRFALQHSEGAPESLTPSEPTDAPVVVPGAIHHTCYTNF